MRFALVFLLVFAIAFPAFAAGQESQTPAPEKGIMLLTVFLRHDQSKALGQIDRHLQQTGF